MLYIPAIVISNVPVWLRHFRISFLFTRSKVEDKLRHVEDNSGKHDLEKTITGLEQTLQDLEEKNQELTGSVRTSMMGRSEICYSLCGGLPY